MVILSLIDVQYSQTAVFSFEKGSIVKITPPHVPFAQQKNSLPQVKFLIPPTGEFTLPPLHPLPLFGKPWLGIIHFVPNQNLLKN